jgi:hypothetical protein
MSLKREGKDAPRLGDARSKEVLKMLAASAPIRTVCRELGLSPNTVMAIKRHRLAVCAHPYCDTQFYQAGAQKWCSHACHMNMLNTRREERNQP